VGDEVREELELLRAEVRALAERPTSIGQDLGGFTPVKALHGVGEKYARLLQEAGIETVSELLAATATPEGRKRLESTALSLSQLRKWSREADLLRLHGVGPGEVALLESGGITSTAELALQDGMRLYQQLRRTAEARGDVALPSLEWVRSWIEQAAHLPPVVEW
jgi:predicted flap endonuclease-1-like 5' DNA nuclease